MPIKDLEKHRQKVAEYRKKNPWIKTFNSIQRRCKYPNHSNYKAYGGRGIKCLITTAELKYLWFRDKAHEMKEPTIDRKENDGHYCLDNCEYKEKKDNLNAVQKKAKEAKEDWSD